MSNTNTYGDGQSFTISTSGTFAGIIGSSGWKPSASPFPDEPEPLNCVACGGVSGYEMLCELCRQAILLFRRKVLEEMARDLLEMSDEQ